MMHVPFWPPVAPPPLPSDPSRKLTRVPTSRPCRAGKATSGAASTGQGWFLGFHYFTKYVKVAFFRGTSLRPVPSGDSKQKEVRYLDTMRTTNSTKLNSRIG